MRSNHALQHPAMAPARLFRRAVASELFNTDKSSLSVRARQGGVHKVSDWHCALPDKNSHEQKKAHQFLGGR